MPIIFEITFNIPSANIFQALISKSDGTSGYNYPFISDSKLVSNFY